MMNQTIETLLSHRSVRKFEDRLLTDDQIHRLVEVAQRAATSSFVQAYSIIGIKDEAKKQKLAELAGDQPYVAKNGHLFVFCADLYRHELAGEIEGIDVKESLETTETFMVSLIDAALAAQNAVVAAESEGLGICYIGGIRNHAEEVSELLQLPERVVPLFGLVVGYPAHTPGQKPRLPLEHVYHDETYEQDERRLKEQIEAYNETISNYYEQRTKGARNDRWTDQVAKKMATPTRTYMKDFLQRRHVPLK